MYAVNHYEWIVTNYAALKAGLILVCINPAYQPRELNFALNHVGLKAIVSDTVYGRIPFSKVLNAAMDQGRLRSFYQASYLYKFCALGHTLEHVIFLGESDFYRNDTNVHLLGNLLEGADSIHCNEVEKRIADMDFDSGTLLLNFNLSKSMLRKKS